MERQNHYPTQQTCGVWLMYIGVIIGVAVLSGGELLVQPWVFGLGYAFGFIGILVLPFVNRWLARGKTSPFQDKMDNLATILNVVLCSLCGLVIGLEDLRLLWLSILFVVGVHFIGFYFSQGKWVVILGILTILNASLGLFIQELPFFIIGMIDGALKFIVGVRMFLLKERRTTGILTKKEGDLSLVKE